jgi:hypothetical protein
MLRSDLRYDPATGCLWWLRNEQRKQTSNPAGWFDTKIGYPRIQYRGKAYLSHRIIWCMQTGRWPKHEVDHKDGNPRNNKWLNLRAATRAENMANKFTKTQNRSGHKGVYWHKHTKQWFASLRFKNKTYPLGYFRKLEEAGAAYVAAAKKIHGEFARVR